MNLIFEEIRAIQCYLQSDRAAKESAQISAISSISRTDDVYMKQQHTGVFCPAQ